MRAKPFCCLLTLLCVACVSGWAAPLTVYVAPDGDDANAGAKDAPVATPARALELIREARATRAETPKENDRIVLMRGTYPITEPLRFGPADSALTITAEGGDAVLYGGKPITGWEPAGGNRWTAKVPGAAGGAWPFRQLWKDGRRLTRARFPNGEGLLRLVEVGEAVKTFMLDEEPPGGGLAGHDAELVVIQNWSIARVRVARSEGATVHTRNPAGWIGHNACTASAGKPAFLENAPAFLDAPGEWYLDRDTGVVTYLAEKHEHPNACGFVAPVAEQWVVIAGERGNPVRNLRFENVAFAYAAWPLPDTGYQGIQAGHFSPSMKGPANVLPVAVQAVWAEQCAFEECAFAHTGASGLGLGAGCVDNAITQCAFNDIGGNGVMVGWRGGPLSQRQKLTGDASLSADWTDPAYVPRRNVLADSTLRRCGEVAFGSVAVYDGFCDGTRIMHNMVHEMPYTGISIGFRWNMSETSQRNTRVEHNHVFDVMKKLADGGCIYSLGWQPGTALEANVLHGVHRSEYAHGGAPNNGIFFDQGSKGYLVKENIIYDTSGEPIRFNQTGPEHLIFVENHFGVAPDDAGFPGKLAGQAGPRK